MSNTLDEILINLDEYKLNRGGVDFSVAEHYAMYPELKSAKLAIETLITEARIDEVEKYDNHCAREMAMLQGEEKANGSLAVLKEQGYGSPYAKDRLKTLKEQS